MDGGGGVRKFGERVLGEGSVVGLGEVSFLFSDFGKSSLTISLSVLEDGGSLLMPFYRYLQSWRRWIWHGWVGLGCASWTTCSRNNRLHNHTAKQDNKTSSSSSTKIQMKGYQETTPSLKMPT